MVRRGLVSLRPLNSWAIPPRRGGISHLVKFLQFIPISLVCLSVSHSHAIVVRNLAPVLMMSVRELPAYFASMFKLLIS